MIISSLSLSHTDGWAKDDLIYKWKEKDPVQVVPGLHLPRFTLEQYKSAYCDVKTNTGKFHRINLSKSEHRIILTTANQAMESMIVYQSHIF